MIKTTFCEDCRTDVTYTVESVTLCFKHSGVKYEYEGKKALCNKCGEEVYVHEIADSNLHSPRVLLGKES